MDARNFASSRKDTPAASDASATEIPAEYQPLLPAGRVLARQLLIRGPINGKQAQLLFPDREAALVLGMYLLLERLGQDGTGAVFKAVHVLMGREVALRLILAPGSRSSEQRARFRKEMQLAAPLRHPNLVMVFDVVEVAGLCVLVMEYVPGVDLNARVGQVGRLPITEACSYIRQAALGLQAAHEHGLVHGDVQPARILIAGDQTSRSGPDVLLPEAALPAGVVRLLNLGLAWRYEVDEGAGQTGPCSPDYVSPEQAKDLRQANVRSDLYSLGCTLYFALTGRPPFPRGTALEKLFQHQFEESPPVARLRPDVPRVLGAIVQRLLAKRPADRYQDAAELAEALAPFCTTHFEDRPEGARPDSSFRVRTPPELTGSDTNPVVAMPGAPSRRAGTTPGSRRGWPLPVLLAGAVAVGLAAAWVIRFLLDMN